MFRLRHTAYVLSSRMSTPALGWSRLGASKMARLRELSYNKESMFDCGRQSDTISPSRSKRYFDNNVQLDYQWIVQVLSYKHEEFSIMYFPTANLRYRKII